MKNYKEIFDSIELISKENGASNVKIIKVEQIEFNPIFRDMCIANHCGMYNKCYMCPPSIGKVEKLVEIIKKYKFAAVFQTITTLEDSYDFEGMLSAKKTIFSIIEGLRELCEKLNLDDVMLFGPGGCGVCEKCAKEINEVCRFPELAIHSLEAYCVDVYKLANTASMKYINGNDTVTYFGFLLFGGETLG